MASTVDVEAFLLANIPPTEECPNCRGEIQINLDSNFCHCKKCGTIIYRRILPAPAREVRWVGS